MGGSALRIESADFNRFFIIVLFMLPAVGLTDSPKSHSVYESMLAQNTSGQNSAGIDTGTGTPAPGTSTKPASLSPASLSLTDLSLDQIAKELSNPVTALASIKSDFEYHTYQGDLSEAGDQSNMRFLFRPSVPIPLENGKNILMRATIPIYVDLPAWQVPFGHPLWIQDFDYPDFRLRQAEQITDSTGEFANVHGHLGDIGFDIAYGGVSDSGFISMYGIATVLEASTNISASRNQWLLGPEIALGKSTDWGVIGAWVTHLVNITGGELYPTSETTAEIFFAYGLGNGWQIFSSPKVTYDWEADSGNELLLPIGAGVSKTARFGSTPVKMAVEIQKFVVSPDRFGTEWLLTLSFTPVIRNPFQK